MKNTFFIFTLFISILAFSQVKWMTMNQAISAQKRSPKKILIDFYVDWCGPCKLMDKHTYSHPEIARYINENYYPVKFNGEGSESVTYMGRRYENPDYQVIVKGNRNSTHQFTKRMNVMAFPSLVFIDEKGRSITSLVGYFKPEEVEPYLHVIVSDDYKNIETREQWEDFQSKFKSRIRN